MKAEPTASAAATVKVICENPAAKNLPPHLLEPAQGKLDANREQEQDDADFGESFDVPRIGDKRERIGTEQHAGDDEAGERGKFETMERQNYQQRAGEDDGEIAKDVQLLHGGLKVGRLVALATVRDWLQNRVGLSPEVQTHLLVTIVVIAGLWILERLVLAVVYRRVPGPWTRYRSPTTAPSLNRTSSGLVIRPEWLPGWPFPSPSSCPG